MTDGAVERVPSKTDGVRVVLEVDGEERWSRSLAPHEVGTTVISGPVGDQQALHGLLGKVRDLGLPLLSVTRT